MRPRNSGSGDCDSHLDSHGHADVHGRVVYFPGTHADRHEHFRFADIDIDIDNHHVVLHADGDDLNDVIPRHVAGTDWNHEHPAERTHGQLVDGVR